MWVELRLTVHTVPSERPAWQEALAPFDADWNLYGAGLHLIDTPERLTNVLAVVQGFHCGYILPEAATWDAMQQAARETPPASAWSPGLPDFWL